mgnify:FL=1
MKISHVLYKVNNLEDTVSQFRNQGFTVEYGKKDKPYNALIYFEEGPYIELIQRMYMPIIVQKILHLFGKRKFVEGLLAQNNAQEGYIRIACETTTDKFSHFNSIFREKQFKTIKVPVKRNDVYGYKLKCKCLFPFDANVPFIKSPFKTKRNLSCNHANGIKGIKKIRYKTNSKYLEIVQLLNTDSILEVEEGEFEIDVEF